MSATTKALFVRKLFAQEHGALVTEVQHFAKLGQQYAKLSINECNGDPHPNAVDRKDKNECAKLWKEKADTVAKQMTDLAKRWGFDHLDFGVGFYPTLQLGENQTDGTVMFPYDD